ncbi:MAG: potassium channel family protein [Chitinophagales bacterium]|nr:potassium channel family protein [Chitinophagales bacterium]
MNQPKNTLKNRLNLYRFEILLISLVFLIFDKIFFPNNLIYLEFVWPINMLLIAIASYGIFNEKKGKILWIRNVLTIISISMPFLFLVFNQELLFLYFLTSFYILFYTFIFVEVMRQITYTREVRLNVVIGSFCGYLLLSMIALFCFILLNLLIPNSFSNLSNLVAENYQKLLYFSFITLTSIGFGDILPLNDSSQLLVAFFGMLGQFYMVAVVGIIISRFTSK